MKVAYIADARSAIAQSWIRHFIDAGHEVHVLSAYPCTPAVLSGAKIYQFPIAFSQLSRIGHNGTVDSQPSRTLLSRGLASLRSGALSQLSTTIVPWAASFEIRHHVRAARELINHIAPDLVHAMRIPFEGILAGGATPKGMPLLISVWGNDFTLFANRNPLIALQTRDSLRRADGLLCDCRRDLEIARRALSFGMSKLAVVLPGGGGIQSSIFYPGKAETALRHQLSIPDDSTIIINPRGFRAYVRNDVFFRAIPRVLRQFPKAVFICP
ncbi:MAG: glycosyltransferase, partial [Pyrinomonadaceae bacterium]